jgi:hypothetical protein
MLAEFTFTAGIAFTVTVDVFTAVQVPMLPVTV